MLLSKKMESLLSFRAFIILLRAQNVKETFHINFDFNVLVTVFMTHEHTYSYFLLSAINRKEKALSRAD